MNDIRTAARLVKEALTSESVRQEALQATRRCLGQGDFEDQCLLVVALKKLAAVWPPAIGCLVDALSVVPRGVGEEARKALLELGEPGWQALAQALEHPHPRAREQAAMAMFSQSFRSADLPVLLEALADPVEEVGLSAALALVQVVEQDPEAASALLELFGSSSGLLRARAASAVGRLGVAHWGQFCEPLEALLWEEDPGLRRAAMEAFFGWGGLPSGAAERLAPFVLDALADQDLRLRMSAERLLTLLPGAHPGVAPALLQLALDGSTEALRALRSAHEQELESLLPEVMQLLEEAPLGVLLILEKLGPLASEELPALVEFLGREGPRAPAGVLRCALAAAGRMGAPAEVFRPWLHHTEPLVREAARSAYPKS